MIFRRSIAAALLMVALSTSLAAGANPYPRTFDFNATLNPDCSSVLLTWTWSSVAGESSLSYGIYDSDGNFQGGFTAGTFASGSASDTRSMAPAVKAHRFRVVSRVFDGAGNVLLTGTNRFRMACNL